MLFAGLGSVRKVKNCDRGLENAAPRADKSQMVMNEPSPQERALRKEPQSTKSSNEIFIALQNFLPWSRLLVLETGLCYRLTANLQRQKMICQIKLDLNYVEWDELSFQSNAAKLFSPFWHVIFQ